MLVSKPLLWPVATGGTTRDVTEKRTPEQRRRWDTLRNCALIFGVVAVLGLAVWFFLTLANQNL